MARSGDWPQRKSTITNHEQYNGVTFDKNLSLFVDVAPPGAVTPQLDIIGRVKNVVELLLVTVPTEPCLSKVLWARFFSVFIFIVVAIHGQASLASHPRQARTHASSDTRLVLSLSEMIFLTDSLEVIPCLCFTQFKITPGR